MSHRILQDDWSAYDDKKDKSIDKHFFSCQEKWEVDYLVGMIRKHKPTISEQKIRTAIAETCQEVKGNKPRAVFVEAVMAKLQLSVKK